MKLICIKCPRGCEIEINGDEISGYSCQMGLNYAKEELVCPKRTVTYLAKCGNSCVPVKTDVEVPKADIQNVIEEIAKIQLKSAKIGQIIIKNVAGTGANIIVTGNPYINKD